MLHRKKMIADNEGSSEEDGIRAAGQREAKIFLEKYHYLKTLPVGCVCFGLWKNCNLLGVAAFGVPASISVQKMIFGEDKKRFVWELRRFALANNEKNLASMFLSRALDKLCKVKEIWAVVSFADQGVGHFGIIYQACSAIYFGSTGKELCAISPGGSRLSGMHLKKLKSVEGVEFEISPGKHKYCFVLGNRKEKKERQQLLKISNLPYPKS
jgi:hypothetical protein